MPIKKTLLLVFAAGIILSSFSIAHSTQRYEFRGYSILAPDSGDWIVKRDKQRIADIMFYKYFDTPKADQDGQHYLIATAKGTILPISNKSANKEDIFKIILARGRKKLNNGPIHNIHFESKIIHTKQTDCVRIDGLSEVKSQKDLPVYVSLFESHTLACLHPDQPNYLIEVAYGQVTPNGMVPATIKDEGEAFLISLQFSDLKKPEM